MTALIANVHGLFDVATPFWISELKGRPVRPDSLTESWDVDSESDEEVTARLQQPGEDFDLQAFVKRQRGNCFTFAKQSPGPKLIVTLMCSAPQVSYLHRLERIASAKFEQDELHTFIRTGQCSSRIREATGEKLTGQLFDQHWRLISNPSAWPMLPNAGWSQSLANFAFAMSSTACCAYSQLLGEPADRMPRQLWQILDGEDGLLAVQSVPDCMHTDFSRSFIRSFGGKDHLGGPDVKVVLWQAERLLRQEITGLECRNASVRRCTRKSQTNSTGFAEVPVGERREESLHHHLPPEPALQVQMTSIPRSATLIPRRPRS